MLNNTQRSTPEFVTVERTASELRITYKPASYLASAMLFLIGIFCWFVLVVILTNNKSPGLFFWILPFPALFFFGLLFFIGSIEALKNKLVFIVREAQTTEADPFRGASSKKLLCHLTGVRTTTKEYYSEGLLGFEGVKESFSRSSNCELRANYQDHSEELTRAIFDLETAKYIAQLLEAELLGSSAKR